jgi:serine/threonine protein kinase
MLTKLTHPCVLNLYGISSFPNPHGKGEDDLYMVMQYCGGGDLEVR